MLEKWYGFVCHRKRLRRTEKEMYERELRIADNMHTILRSRDDMNKQLNQIDETVETWYSNGMIGRECHEEYDTIRRTWMSR